MIFVLPSVSSVVAAASAIVLAVPVPAAARAVTEGPAESAFVDVVSVAGTGCPAGSASIAVLPDNTGFEIVFTGFRASAGGGAGPAEFRKSCSILLTVRSPEGFTAAIARTDFRGAAYLDPGTSGVVRSSHYFAGMTPARTSSRTFAGPLDGGWQATDIIDPADQIYAPCGVDRAYTFHTELRVSPGLSAEPLRWMSLTAADAEIQSVVEFAWREC